MSEKKTVSVRMDAELHGDFKEACQLQKVTMQAVLEKAILDFVSDTEGLKAIDFNVACAVEESEV